MVSKSFMMTLNGWGKNELMKFTEMELKYRFNSPSVGLKKQSFDSFEMEIKSQKKIHALSLIIHNMSNILGHSKAINQLLESRSMQQVSHYLHWKS